MKEQLELLRKLVCEARGIQGSHKKKEINLITDDEHKRILDLI